MSARHDFLRDWHRWTAAERVSAALLGTIAAISLPAAILVNLHLGGDDDAVLDWIGGSQDAKGN